MSPFYCFIKQDEAFRILVEDVVEDILEMVELKLEMAEVGLDTLAELDFAEEGVEDACLVAGGRYKAADLAQDS